MKNLGIVGAGPSGLSLGYFLKTNFEIYEADSRVGGHAQSIQIDGFTFDRGPHILFSRDKVVLDFMLTILKDNVHNCVRNNRVWFQNLLLHYPIENDLGKLGIATLEDIISSLHDWSLNPLPEENLEVWFNNHFGKVLTDLYFKPYNEKVWKTQLMDLSMTWSERIPKPPFRDILAGVLGSRREGYIHQLHYQYPLIGGFQALSIAFEDKLSKPVRLNTEIRQIDNVNSRVRLYSDSTYFEHEEVVWTGYLDTLVNICQFTIPQHILEDIASLRVNPMSCLTLAFVSDEPPQYSAIYVPGAESVFNRISFPTVFSPNNSPLGTFLVQAEVTYGESEDNFNEHTLSKDLIHLLQNIGIIRKDQAPIFSHLEHYAKAYVVYSVGYEKKIERVKNYFKSKGIILHGRFGAFNYINTDMCVLESAKLASKYLDVENVYELLI